MKPVNVTAFRRNLPGYLAMVGRGEKISITRRGRVIAEISLPTPTGDEVSIARARLRCSLLRYDGPFEPAIPTDEWEMNR